MNKNRNGDIQLPLVEFNFITIGNDSVGVDLFLMEVGVFDAWM